MNLKQKAIDKTEKIREGIRTNIGKMGEKYGLLINICSLSTLLWLIINIFTRWFILDPFIFMIASFFLMLWPIIVIAIELLIFTFLEYILFALKHFSFFGFCLCVLFIAILLINSYCREHNNQYGYYKVFDTYYYYWGIDNWDKFDKNMQKWESTSEPIFNAFFYYGQYDEKMLKEEITEHGYDYSRPF